MAKEENMVTLEALSNEGERTGQTNEFEAKVAEKLLQMPHSKWVKSNAHTTSASDSKKALAEKNQ